MNFKKMKLATKISLAIASTLTLLLTILIVISILSVNKQMTRAINGEFSSMANENGIIVQGIMDTATNTAQNIQDYLKWAYVEYDNLLTTQATDANGNKIPLPTQKSLAYDVKLSQINKDAEEYMLHSAWSIVNSNPDIVGIGAFFEPYAFDDNIKDYAIYIGEADAKEQKVHIYGAYSEYSTQNFYTQPASSQKNYFTKPFVDHNMTLITAAFPIIHNNETQGVINVDINVENFAKVKSSNEKYPTMFSIIITSDGTIVYDSQSADLVGKNLSSVLGEKQFQKISEKAKAGVPFNVATSSKGTGLMEYYFPIQAGEEVWWSITAIEKSDLNKAVVNLSIMMVMASLFILASIIVTVIILLKRMLAPITGVVAAVEQIALGELDIQLEVKSEDEIGMLSRAFFDMSERLKTIISDVRYLLGEMSQGNFNVRTQYEDSYIGNYHDILLAMRGINRNLSDTLRDIDDAANHVSVGSEQVAASGQALSLGATEQASAIEELTATLSEISQRIGENAESAAHAHQLANESGINVKESNAHMEYLMKAMNQITETSTEIEKIIKAIDDIAFQTNILALNAAIEAARAGEAGKGFVVVADEVRHLAAKCAEAAKDTTDLIKDSINAVENGMKHAVDTAHSLELVVAKTETVDETILKIAKASEEQSYSITQLTIGVEEISAVVQTNSATAEESAAASEELSGQAFIMKNLVGKFRLRKD